jgi:hypothetical protein
MKKFRPYFTLAELKHLHSLSFKDSQISHLTRYLESYINQIDNGFISSQLTVKGKKSIEDKLELNSSSRESSKESLTKFERYQSERYLNNEMSPTEEAEYEKSMGISF